MKLILFFLTSAVLAGPNEKASFCFFSNEKGFLAGRMLSEAAAVAAIKKGEKSDQAYDHLHNCMHITAPKEVLAETSKRYVRLMKGAPSPRPVHSGKRIAVSFKDTEVPVPALIADEKNNEIRLSARAVHEHIVEYELSLNGGKTTRLYRGFGPKETVPLDLLLKEWAVQNEMFAKLFLKSKGKKQKLDFRFFSARKLR